MLRRPQSSTEWLHVLRRGARVRGHDESVESQVAISARLTMMSGERQSPRPEMHAAAAHRSTHHDVGRGMGTSSPGPSAAQSQTARCTRPLRLESAAATFRWPVIMAGKEYRKYFVPLESSPEVFNRLIWHIGVAPSLAFHDVLSLEDSELLDLIPRPVHALVLVFPTAGDYERKRRELAATNLPETEQDEGNDIVWFKQTIHNACGLYGILHAVANGKARRHIGKYLLLPTL